MPTSTPPQPSSALTQSFFQWAGYFSRQLPSKRVQKAIVARILRWRECKLDFPFYCAGAGVTWSASGFPDLLTRVMLFEGAYQQDVLWALRTFIQPGDTVFDIGGHHGLMSVVSGQAAGPTGRVFTFEPNPHAREHIRRHLELNKLRNVTIEEIALSDQVGEFPFYIQSGNLSWNSTLVKDFANFKNREAITVRTEPLDAYVERTGRIPRVMKIDTEGSEFMVLQGARGAIAAHQPLMIMEFNPASATSAGTTLEEYAEFLRSLGYALRVPIYAGGQYSRERMEEFSVERHTADDLVNVICIPAATRGK
ncbi:MAG: FkbM family methyltransferase [Pirellulales bacterium]|nr:FkbM family methyltransferase [Pirellulales bacterium]